MAITLAVIGAVPLISRTGNCYDNVPMKSFFHTLKVKLVYQYRWAMQAGAPGAVRIHGGLLQSTPHALGHRIFHSKQTEQRMIGLPGMSAE
jgi:transposase InsO family protein